MSQIGRLQRILAMLPPTDAEWLAQRLAAETETEPGGWGYAARDAAVREALAHYAALLPTVAAKALEHALGAYLDGAWQADRQNNGPPSGAEAHRWALFNLAHHNDEKDLGWRRIHDIGKSG